MSYRMLRPKLPDLYIMNDALQKEKVLNQEFVVFGGIGEMGNSRHQISSLK